MILPPHKPLPTGGGGAVVETLLAVMTLGAAALSALVVRVAPGRPDEGVPRDEDGAKAHDEES
jgi:hypothetical protein